MEFYKVGGHCFYCKQRDFLPLVCPICKNKFCKDHINTHGCNPIKSNPKIPPKKKKIKRNCKICNKKLSLVTCVICKNCNENFCYMHSSPSVHKCILTAKELRLKKTPEEQIIESSNKWCFCCNVS